MPMNADELKHQPKNWFERHLRRVKYKADWILKVLPVDKHFFLQVWFVAPCIVTGEMKVHKGRKWLLSVHMTETELFNTAFKAIQAAEEHEMRERFLIDDTAVFNPHVDLNDLAARIVDGDIGIDVRPDHREEKKPVFLKKKRKKGKKS